MAHKQGDMIYTGTYRDMEHTVTYRDMESTCTNRRRGTQAQTKGKMIYRHTNKETWYTQAYTYLLEQKALYTVTNKRNLIQRHSNKET